MALGEEIANRDEIEQHDREADRREICGAAPAPADAARREQLERVDEPAEDSGENLRILQGHGLHARIYGVDGRAVSA